MSPGTSLLWMVSSEGKPANWKVWMKGLVIADLCVIQSHFE